MNHTNIPDLWGGDDPLDSRDGDRLGRYGFATEAANTIRRLTARGDSSVVALIGPWGAGKSTVLEYIQASLEAADHTANSWIVIPFNPWFYQDLTSLQIGFFQAIHASLPGDGRKKARDRLADFAETIAPYGGLLSFTGVDPSGAMSAVAKAIRGSTAVGDLHAEADSALRSAKQPILVVLDDLDRLDPPELLLVLKLIRLAGRLSNVHYLISFDEKTLLDVLSRTGLIGSDDARRGIEYLEKIVQLRLDLPPMRDQQISDWVDEGLAELERRHDLTMSEADRGRFARAYLSHLRERLTTPRAIKRYFTQVDSTIDAVRGEVNTADLLLITWLRSAEPVLYHNLNRARERLVGEGGVAEAVARMVAGDAPEDRDFWVEEFAASKVRAEDTTGVAEIVGEMFPRFRHAWFRTSFDKSRLAETGRITHRDYFDRYFAFAVPDEDVADSLVEVAYGQLLYDRDGAELRDLTVQLTKKPGLVLAKLDDAFRAEQEGGFGLLAWLVHNVRAIPISDALMPPMKLAEALGQSIYESLSPEERTTIVGLAAADVEKLKFIATLVARVATRSSDLRSQGDGTVVINADAASEREFSRLVIEHLSGLGATNPLRYDFSTSQLIWALRWVDPGELRKWTQAQAAAGAWPLLDFAARLVTSQKSDRGTDERELTGLEMDAVDVLVGLDALIAEVGTELSTGEIEPWSHPDETDDNRRGFVHRGLQEALDRRGRSAEN